jgi:hypothetical protein
MAETLVTKSAAASRDTTTGMIAPQSSNDILGEDIAAPGVPLRMHTDGKLYRATAAAANASARIYGWSTRAAKAGMSMTTVGVGAIFKYSDEGLTPGAIYYLAETVGALSSIATTGDAVGCCQAKDESNIRITRNI